eukprot:CAMPEP_0183823710 /NCGR_PEP_ID=MMETSP0807_2-20130328/202_1 /TAXON_ID=88271 /ORGANISM="Picocystis salinarum, Strain CCMP1897" /LENGTH=796 /DNA_ID=CAMNT_0026068617 /DNA_START=19 /DNA_END=2409 /DNA_ORIENTATION=-
MAQHEGGGRMLRGHMSLQMMLGILEAPPRETKRPKHTAKERDGTSGRSKEIVTRVVGRKWHAAIRVEAGDEIRVERENDNQMDENAIRVVQEDSHALIGYLPARTAAVLSPLMDEGVLKLQAMALEVGDPKEVGRPLPIKLNLEFVGRNWRIEEMEGLMLKVQKNEREYPLPGQSKVSIQKTCQVFRMLLNSIDTNDLLLLDEQETALYRSLGELPEAAMAFFARLLTRKGPWFRLDKLTYMDEELTRWSVSVLCSKSLIEEATGQEEQQLRDMLCTLTVQELKSLLLGLRLATTKELSKTTKNELLDISCRQNAAIQYFTSDALSPTQRLIVHLKEHWGPWIRISDVASTLIRRMQFFLFLEYNSDFSKYVLADMGVLQYPKYNVNKGPALFQSREEMLEYEEIVFHARKIEALLSAGNIDGALEEMKPSLEKLESGAVRKCAPMQESEGGPPFYLARFSASWVHAAIGNIAVSIFESRKQYVQANDVLHQLLGTRCLVGKRGSWWQRLCINLEHQKKHVESLEMAEAALADEHVKCGDRIAIQKRVLRLGKPPRRWKRPAWAHSLPDDPNQVRIVQEPVKRKVGFKNVFCGLDGKPCSVESLALQWYGCSKNGCWRGVHDEGGSVRAIFTLLFWDVIFDSKVQGVFRSKFQSMPLDWNSDAFCISRQESIENMVSSIRESSVEDLLSKMATCWEVNYGAYCRGINWDSADLGQLQTIASCLSPHGIAGICRCLAEDHAGWSGGMPDLILWKPEQEAAKLVEVKGPRDRLSEQQRAWIAFLTSQGIEVEVFKVSE